MGSEIFAPLTKKMSRRPSPSQSNSATPAPMVSMRYFWVVADDSCLKCTPSFSVTSTNCVVLVPACACFGAEGWADLPWEYDDWDGEKRQKHKNVATQKAR